MPTAPFGDRLAEAVTRVGVPLAVGLDPHLDQLPKEMQAHFVGLSGAAFRAEAARSVLEFNLTVLEAIEGMVGAVKPQFAFYEQLGAPGWAALEATVARAKDMGFLVIGDAKRGDIGSTMAAYGRAMLDPEGPLGMDALTVNPWMGTDTLEPLMPWCEAHGRGLFVLARTTNPGSAEFQLHGEPRAAWKLADALERMGGSTRGSSGTHALGAVVGASAAEHAVDLREHMPGAWFLVPGVGAQGGSAAQAMAGMRADGLGSLPVASRSVLFPRDLNDGEPRDAIRRAAEALVEAVKSVRDGVDPA
jgi:orotidine-5'-phosphate decarboxylase